MKTSYCIKLGGHWIAIADVSPVHEGHHRQIGIPEVPACWLNRINVPPKFRGQGCGSNLLSRVLQDADAEGILMVLMINPYGDMTYEQLKDWYERNGFETIDEGIDLLIRYPQDE